MKVTVIEKAFYGGSLRDPGTTLEVPEDFKASWAVPAGTIGAKPVKQPTPAMASPVALSQLGKTPPKSFNDVYSAPPSPPEPVPETPPEPPLAPVEPPAPEPVAPEPVAPPAAKRKDRG